jgi:hypothetical protein
MRSFKRSDLQAHNRLDSPIGAIWREANRRGSSIERVMGVTHVSPDHERGNHPGGARATVIAATKRVPIKAPALAPAAAQSADFIFRSERAQSDCMLHLP